MHCLLKLSIAASFVACLVNGQSQPIRVEFPNGAAFVGASKEGVDSFLGIQYGKVGERFSRSSLVNYPPDDSTQVNAIDFGPDCHQVYFGFPEFLHQPRAEAEECLYLNIWRPSATSSKQTTLLPIMVWIHGGGLMIGSGANKVHDGTNLARSQQIIVISFNYRLGALGFLAQDTSGTGAMNGLFDQLNALQWIKTNAEAFGGDPEQVTIFGESSGSESVCMLSVSPLAKELFHRSIMQSGDCIYNPWAYGMPSDDIDTALQAVDTLMNATGAMSMEELRNSTLVDGAAVNTMAGANGWWIIVLDKEILPQHPRHLYLDASNIVPVDFMIGANSHEDLTPWGMSPEEYLGLAESGLNETIHTLVGSKYGPQVAENVFDAYNARTNYDNDTVAAYSQFQSDWNIGCPTRAFASDILSVVSGDVYLYNFAHFAITDPAVHFGLDSFINTTSWASHEAEIPFVFGTLDYWKPMNSTISAQDQAMSDEIMTRWANFAKTGNPNLIDNEVDKVTIWEPLAKETAANSLRGGDTLASFHEPLVMLFDQGQSQMSKLQSKAKQCAAFPFGKGVTSVETGTGVMNGSSEGGSGDHDGPTVTSGGNTRNTLAFWSLVWCMGISW